MGLPLPKVVSDVGPGGGLVTAMRGMNALAENMLKSKIEGVKAYYEPYTTAADINSKNAYARLVGLQPIGKLLANSDAFAQLSDDEKRVVLDRFYKSGTGNSLNQPPGGQGGVVGGQPMPSQPMPPSQQAGGNPFSLPPPPQDFSLSAWAVGKLKNIFSGGQGGNIPQEQSSNNVDLSGMQPGQSYTNQSSVPQNVSFQGGGSNSGYAYDQNGNNIKATPQEVADIANGQNSTERPQTYAEKAGAQKGTIAEGAELGTLRAKDIDNIGKQQLDLSNSGMILDRLVGITQNPEFQKMRDQIPYFQDKQLWYLSKNGTKAQQDMIGDLISTAQAFKASTVNSFKGKALEKEFNLADKIKIDENDTMGVIQGKLRSLKTLKQIAETKNNVILGLMSGKQHMNLGDAIKIANKRVDTSAIEKEVDSVLNPQPTEHDIQYMMKKRNLPRGEIIKQLKARGYKNVS